MLGHPWRHAGEQTAPATRGSRRESEEMPTVARSTPHARTQRSVSTSPASRASSTTTSDVRHWYTVGRPARCVFSSTHRRDADDTANAHSSAVSCSHTTAALAPAREFDSINSQPSETLYAMVVTNTAMVVTERGGEEEGQGEDESCKLCVEEDDGSHGCCMLLMLSLELGLISLWSLTCSWVKELKLRLREVALL